MRSIQSRFHARRFRPRLWLLLLALLGIVSCGRSEPGPPVVVASLPPLASLVRTVAGDSLEVLSFLPSGRSPHDFEPSPALVERVRDAVLFVRVGGHLDPWMVRTARSLGEHRAQLLELHPTADPEADWDVDRHHHDGEFEDQHYWLDLDTVLAFLPRLGETLAERDPAGAAGYRRRAAEAVAELEALDEESRRTLAPVRDIPFALLHPAFSRLCRRYDLRLVAVLQEMPEGEASPRTLATAARELRAAEARVIFAQPDLNPRLAESMAHEVGAEVHLLDPLGAATDGGDDYFTLLRSNVARLKETLERARH